MKTRRIIKWTMAAFLSATLPLFVTSCSTEDNPAKPTQGSAVITVNNAAIFDQLGITDDMPQWLEKGSLTIVDSVLIYDQAGNLVTKLGVETSTMDPMTIDASGLPNGTYTLVAWETTIDRNKSGAWFVADDEQLSTVNIYTKYGGVGYMWAFGYATATVTVDGSTIQAYVTPVSPSSIVDFQVDNFTEDKGYSTIRLRWPYAGYIHGLRLDPSLGEEERWIPWEGYSENVGSLNLGTSHNKFLTFTHGDNVLFSVYGYKEDGSREYIDDAIHQFGIGQHAVFHIDMDKHSWQAPFFGTPEEFAPWKAERDAGILDFFPCINWGCNGDEVQQYVQSRRWWADRFSGETRYWESENVWYRSWFIAHRSAEEYVFTTENCENLKWVYLRCFDTNLSVEAINNSFLIQGYEYAGKVIFPGEDPRDILFSPDGETEVQIVVSENGTTIFYQPTDPDDFQYITPADDPIIVH